MSLNSLSREEIEKFSLPHHFSDSNHSNLLLNEHQFASFGIAERYIISLCHVALIDASNAISRHSYGEAINILHDFLWGDFADWYLEVQTFSK
jgi:valyl-tRNA synthetase